MRLRLEKWISLVSPLLIVTDDDGILRALEFGDYESRMDRLLRAHYGDISLEERRVPESLIEKLHAYFAGELAAIEQIQTATGGTPFQKEVWGALRDIPAGTTLSYGQLAGKLNRPGASRAVGAANGANPIPIVVPCHRVIGGNGTLTGYGGGLSHKKWLLDHEARHSPIGALFA
jgi:O-6-methylguanine DNA methyltransferase